MSRSHKKNAVISWCGGNPKKDKRKANKDLRKHTKKLLKEYISGDDDDYVDLELEDVSNRAAFADDGKTRVDDDSEYYEKALRK